MVHRCRQLGMSLSLSNPSVMQLRAAFATFDQDGNGSISRSELIETLLLPGGEHAFAPGEAERAADRIISDFDISNDGVLQFDEFVTWWSVKGAELSSASVTPLASLRQASDLRASTPILCLHAPSYP